MNKLNLLAIALLAAAACGDNKAKPDAPKPIDAPPPDGTNVPAPPTPGAQIDRMGRPAINTALDHTFDVNTTTKGAAKDAYNADAGAGSWVTNYAGEFAKNLALLDFLDSGLACSTAMCANGSAGMNTCCTASTGTNGCGNQPLYNGQPGGGGSAMANSYATLASVLADDELYLDTTHGSCSVYLAVELGSPALLGASLNDCGGRAPSYDVIDVSYTALAIGLTGFDLTHKTAAFGDGVSAHTDISDVTFPFLGAPHNQ